MSNRPNIAAKSVAVLIASIGAAWADRAVTDWTAVGPYLIASGDRLVSLAVFNTHATQTMYILLRASAAEATSLAIPVGPLAAVSIDVYGANVGTISLQGSGAATTARLIASMVAG